jgi:hypothetical protein
MWPTVVHNPNGDNCTNTLIAPNVIMSAGHCFDASNNTGAPIQFGEDFNNPSMTAEVDQCFLNPGYTGSVGMPSGTDISFCTLKQPVTNVPITPILMGCETAILQPGQDVVLVGFGATSAQGGEDGSKRFVHVTVDASDGSTIAVGNASKGACFGDSGGPAFVKLADGTWRVFGATSQGTGAPCQSSSVYTLLHPIVPWLEQTSGVDVTPCFDAHGTWTPGPSCGKFPADPDGPPSSANWSNGCSAIDLSPTVSTTCGPNPLANDAGSGGSDGGADSGSSSGSNGGSSGSSGSSSGSSSSGGGGSSSSSSSGSSSGVAGGSSGSGATGGGPVTTDAGGPGIDASAESAAGYGLGGSAGCQASITAPSRLAVVDGVLSGLAIALAVTRRRRRSRLPPCAVRDAR